MSRRATICLAALAALAALLIPASAANAATYKDTTGLGGGKIVIKIENGRAKSLRANLPARCERDNGDFDTTLRTFLTGSVKLDSKGRFSVHVDDPNTGVEVILGAKLKNGAVRGTLRLTYLDLRPGSPSNDTLCDSGVFRYRAG